MSADVRAMAPDLRGCELHGMSEWRIYHYPPRAPMGRCLACVRAHYHRSKGKGRGPYMGERCVNGHRKTPWTWVPNGTRHMYCKTCANESHHRRYLERTEGKVKRRNRRPHDRAA